MPGGIVVEEMQRDRTIWPKTEPGDRDKSHVRRCSHTKCWATPINSGSKPLSKEEALMRPLKTFSQLFITILLATVVAGCVAAPPPLPPRPSSDFAYYPMVQPGIATVEAAKSDLALMLKDTNIRVERDKKQKPYQFNYGEAIRLQEEYEGRGGKSDISPIFYPGSATSRNRMSWKVDAIGLHIKAFPVWDDRIEVLFNPPLVYRDLVNDNLVVNVVYYGVDAYNYSINFANRYSFHFGPKDLASAQRFVDDLFVIQEHLKRQEKKQLAAFEQQATRYREQAVKPAVSEEQRKLIVQANVLNQQKAYDDALEFYNRALAIDPVSYPGAYFNMALLSAQQNRFQEAIGYMKKYLLLEPNSSDARGSQDKIYEWELLIHQQ